MKSNERLDAAKEILDVLSPYSKPGNGPAESSRKDETDTEREIRTLRKKAEEEEYQAKVQGLADALERFVKQAVAVHLGRFR